MHNQSELWQCLIVKKIKSEMSIFIISTFRLTDSNINYLFFCFLYVNIQYS